MAVCAAFVALAAILGLTTSTAAKPPVAGKERAAEPDAGDDKKDAVDQPAAPRPDLEDPDEILAALHIPKLESLPRPDDSACAGLPVEKIETKGPDDQVVTVQEAVKLKDGRVIPHGETRHFWEGGEKKLLFSNVCGSRHGIKRTWYRSGEVWQQGAYASNRDHGLWREFFPDGHLARQWTMNQGQWHGTFTEWHPNGQVKLKVDWVHGVKQGEELLWDEEGKLRKRIVYVDGVVQP